ncbi:MAG: hypothetical protein DWP97_06185 [Calditrichaeota bacterium]|nr:MAG: hypothetical protein DWP97_06185 [Calditrichota bacterium]
MNLWNFDFSFDLDEKNRLLFGKIYGVWKKETALEYVEELKEVAKPIIDKPWSKMIDLSNWKTVYPDVIQVIGTLNKWCRANNMEWTVYIIDHQVGFSQLMKMFDAGDNRDISRTFRTVAEGEKFLREQGYTIRADSGSIFK